MNEHLLSLTIWIPIVGALLVAIAPKSATKGLSAAAALATMIVSILVAVRFTPVAPPNSALPGFQMVEKHLWIEFGKTASGAASSAPRSPPFSTTTTPRAACAS